MKTDKALIKIISGGQTGVDRAALDVAIELGLSYGGAVPRGRRAEDGPIDRRYRGLKELPEGGYRRRTEQNVLDGDATLIITEGKPTAGTGYTIICAVRQGKPHLVVDLDRCERAGAVLATRRWLAEVRPPVLNVAGPRESGSPGIYEKAKMMLREVLTPCVVGRLIPSKSL
jgi:hypothetical protein